MFEPDEIYIPVGMDIAYQCEDGFVFDHDITNDPIVYTTCEPNGTVIRHGKLAYWPTCVDRKAILFYLHKVNIFPFDKICHLFKRI